MKHLKLTCYQYNWAVIKYGYNRLWVSHDMQLLWAVLRDKLFWVGVFQRRKFSLREMPEHFYFRATDQLLLGGVDRWGLFNLNHSCITSITGTCKSQGIALFLNQCSKLQIQSSRFTDVILASGLTLVTKSAAWKPQVNNLSQVRSFVCRTELQKKTQFQYIKQYM